MILILHIYALMSLLWAIWAILNQRLTTKDGIWPCLSVGIINLLGFPVCLIIAIIRDQFNFYDRMAMWRTNPDEVRKYYDYTYSKDESMDLDKFKNWLSQYGFCKRHFWQYVRLKWTFKL